MYELTKPHIRGGIKIKFIKNVSDDLANYLSINTKLDNTMYREQISYALQAIIGEALRLGILLILFASFGKLHYFVFSFVLLASLRVFAGGYHADSFLKCLLFSTTFFTIAIFGTQLFEKTIVNNSFILLLISTLLIGYKAPITSKFRPIKSKKRYIMLKILAVVTTLLWILALMIWIKDSIYVSVGVLTIFLESVQLFLKRRV
ncbi:accessory gene regulator B family protein [Clostridium sp. 'deep sea']|uniref:accessory gene regulator ArgB-like protein n=1 Tax=Clostridium sp. 'deep sea' TaxID=2779445 RepID=UPI00189655F4|nr:accessory gene regulator B family protein [Clostridium sp. 'deep sea']QOR35280.1 accessory gene regulator B family protein [Clostridium sp. 'deep sea']